MGDVGRQKLFNIKTCIGCKRYEGCISCVLLQISWHLQTQIVKNRILSDSLLETIKRVPRLKERNRNTGTKLKYRNETLNNRETYTGA